MFDFYIYLQALVVMLGIAFTGWLYSRKVNNVTVVDSLWALFFLAFAITSLCLISTHSPRALLIFALVALWSIRLSGYLHWRNHGKPEDKRYAAIRARNEPNFAFKSLYLVFVLQAVLAWVIAMPLHNAILNTSPLNSLDFVGVALWLIGMSFQVTGDLQLARFKSNPVNSNQVLNTGVWRYTRHPNYFGEACIWGGYYCIAATGGAWWSIYSPILMTLLLIKVTGVKLLEADIGERRPAYAAYIRTTNSFFPWFPKE